MITKIKQLKNHQGFMKYLKNTSWLFAEKVLRMVIGLFVGIWVARYLGPEKFGLFSYAQSFVALFMAFSTLGLDGIIVRELVKDKSKEGKLIGTAFWLKLFGSFVLLALLAVAIVFTSNDNYTNTLIFIIASATIFQSFNVIDFYFQAKVLSRYIVFANIISLFISSILKIILILNNAPLIAFAYMVLFDNVVLASGYIYFFVKTNINFSVKKLYFDKRVAMDLLKDSWPLILSGVVISVYMKIDQVMIKQMIDSEAVGQYAAAVRVSETWYFIPMVISSSLFPAIVNAKKISEKMYYQRLSNLYALMIWLAIAIALPMTFSSNWLIELLYGGEFNDAGNVLMIHIWTGVFVFLGIAYSKFLVAENWTKKSFYRTFTGMILNIVLNYILIPKHGIYGAAVATLIGQFTANYVYDIFDKDLEEQFILKTKAFCPIFIFKRGING